MAHAHPHWQITKVVLELDPAEARVLRKCIMQCRPDTWGAGFGPVDRPVALQLLTGVPNAIFQALNQENPDEEVKEADQQGR